MASIIKLGSIFLNGVHTEPGSEYQPEQAIGFANGDDLKWIVVNSMLIADRPVLSNTSWDDLNQQNLVFGRPVNINGQPFLCRLLKVGVEEGASNEWDAALDVVGESDDLWHWRDIFCWGQEYVKPLYCASRGYFSARFWDYSSFDYRSVNVGFRPALVPLPSDNLIPGSEVCAIGSQSVLRGKLLDVTDYDAIIQPDPSSMLADADNQNLYNKLPDGTVVLDRTGMAAQIIKEN